MNYTLMGNLIFSLRLSIGHIFHMSKLKYFHILNYIISFQNDLDRNPILSNFSCRKLGLNNSEHFINYYKIIGNWLIETF